MFNQKQNDKGMVIKPFVQTQKPTEKPLLTLLNMTRKRQAFKPGDEWSSIGAAKQAESLLAP